MATKKCKGVPEIDVPDDLSSQQQEWFAAFVSWYRSNYGSKLDPDNVHKIKPTSAKEGIFLNFLHFHDKYISKRCTFLETEIFRRMHPKTNFPTPGTDEEFHYLAKVFIHYGPEYFVNNSDFKGKSKRELKDLQKKSWITFADSDSD